MSAISFGESHRAFAALRRFAHSTVAAPLERCELCSGTLAPTHPHLIELARRRLVCACNACAVLFSGEAATKYKRVPRRVLSLGDFCISDAQWDSLMIPIGMAFFFQSSLDRKVVALYPSPAGPTESLLSLEAWEEIAKQNPALGEMESDVEALLVNRVKRAGHNGAGSPAGYYLVPIDECYRLVGVIRQNWRGFSGGAEVWKHIADFFDELRDRAISSASSVGRHVQTANT